MRRSFFVLLATCTASLAAQTPAAPAAPTSWQWRLDAPARLQNGTSVAVDSIFRFEDMAPGWHVTMGPGGFLYDPANSASGRFAVQAEMILFPSSSNEEFGLFIGGRDQTAGGEAVSWFVVRRDGKTSAHSSTAGQYQVLSDWTSHEAVKPLAANGSVRTVVRVLAEPDSVRFFIDGTRVGAWARGALPVDGVYGFRIGRGANLHITNLDITRRHAPFPSRR
jgi:hypothetical protein